MNADDMLKQIIIAPLVLLTPLSVQASSTGLFLNDDSVQLLYIGDPAIRFGNEFRLAYNLIYSQEAAPRDWLAGAEIELSEYAWRFPQSQTLTPRVDLLAIDFTDYRFPAAAIGAAYRLAPMPPERKFEVVAEATVAPPLTTFGKGKLLWTFKAQLNYPVADNADLNFGYRSLTMKLLNDHEDGFERGLYFGITTLFF